MQRANVPEKMLWVLLRWGKRNTVDEDIAVTHLMMKLRKNIGN